MLSSSLDYVQDSRPSKRPRNASLSEGHPSAPYLGPVEGQKMEGKIGVGNLRNTRVEGPPAMAGPSNRGRVDDKNNRKLSCKECRRLKLKCDRIFPCQSCIKRGCGSLCPDGALTSGRGSRFILAGAEQLHEKICDLGDRVRQLEGGLELLQSRTSSEPHPLLAPELLKIKTSQELYGSIIPKDTPSTPSASNLSATTRDQHLQQSVRALSRSSQPLYAENSRFNTAEFLSGGDSGSCPDIAPDILQLSTTFPFPWAVDISMRKRIRDALPPRAEAQRICEEARANALWQFNLDGSETFIPNLLHHCYTTQIEALSPRRLALLLMHLSIGSLVDLTRPSGSLQGEAYHHLGRAAVCEIPLMEEPDFDVLHALFFMIWYHLIFSDNRKAVGYAWNLMGFVVKLAQGLGLHRDAPRLKVIPEEHEKRRAVFWELLNMDCRMSLSLGRPPSIRLAHVDIKRPTYVGSGLYVPREEILYHEWKNTFFIQCLTPILEAMVSVQPIEYAHILNLDKAVRDFGVPSLLDDHQLNDLKPRFLVMQRGLVTMGREIALLQLHRKYFTQAMSSPEAFELNHPYAPSVLATYLGSSNLISAVETLFNQEQQLSVRFLHFWFNSFSAVVTLSLLISRVPSSPLATYAFQDLERGCRLFRAAAKILPFSSQALPFMQKLAEKSQRVVLKWHGSEKASQMSYARYPQPKPSLPASFSTAHELIAQSAERVAVRSSTGLATALDVVTLPRGGSSLQPTNLVSTSSVSNLDPATNTFLPDIYHFSTLGLGVEGRHTFASAKTTPFIPSSPRVAENENFNFDHGAMSIELVEETSYMAWF